MNGGPTEKDEWVLSAAQKSAYLNLFSRADADGDGLVGGQEGVAFFSKSGLPLLTLRQIWQLVLCVHESFAPWGMRVCVCVLNIKNTFICLFSG